MVINTNIERNGEAVLYITAEQFMLRRFGYYELSLIVTNIYGYTVNESFENTDITISLYDEYSISYTDIIASENINYEITGSNNEYLMDIDVTKTSELEELIVVRYKTENMDNNHQFLYDSSSLTFMHIFSYEDESVLPRRVIFVLDNSGSMGITKWESAVSATIGAIEQLTTDI